MNKLNLNSPFVVIGGVILVLVLLLAKGQLVLNEEFLLIVNFFLLLGFFYQYVAEILKGFLNSKQELIRNEAHRVLSMHRHNANRLKETYRSKRFMAQIVLSSSIRLHQLYASYQSRVLPRFLPSYINGSFILALETVYNEELQLLRSIYVVKSLLIKERLIAAITSQPETVSSLERSVAILESK